MKKLLNGKVSDMTWKGYLLLMVVIMAMTYLPIYGSSIVDWFREKIDSIKKN